MGFGGAKLKGRPGSPHSSYATAQASFTLNTPSNEWCRFTLKSQIRLLPHKCTKIDQTMLF